MGRGSYPPFRAFCTRATNDGSEASEPQAGKRPAAARASTERPTRTGGGDGDGVRARLEGRTSEGDLEAGGETTPPPLTRGASTRGGWEGGRGETIKRPEGL